MKHNKKLHGYPTGCTPDSTQPDKRPLKINERPVCTEIVLYIHYLLYLLILLLFIYKSTDVSPNRNQHLPLGNATDQDFLSFEELLDQWIPAHLRPKSYHTHVCSKNCCFSCLGLW
jgi:hypothetical protein